MNKTLLTIAVLSFGSLVGCTGTDVIDCNLEPTTPACITACEMDPSRDHCSGADAGPGDGGADAAPDAPTSNCTTECTGQTPICDEDEENAVCVQCLLPTDCDGVEGRPMCVDNACVECTGNEECTEPGASVCSTTGETAGTCVPCAAATSAADCAGVEDDGATALNVCDESGDAGVCVQCNAEDESACDPNVCDVVAKTCTDDTPLGMTPTCGACVSDSQCRPGHACAPTDLDGTDAGYFCLWNLDADEMAPIACSTVRPFGSPDDVSTIAGQEAQVCTLRLSTCAAYNDFSSPGRGSPSCAGEDTPEPDADCGHPDLDDGFCVEEDAASNLCTTRCTSDVDCVFGPLRDEYTCDMSTGLCTFTLL